VREEQDRIAAYYEEQARREMPLNVFSQVPNACFSAAYANSDFL
jgi:hypothetical protein